MLSMRQTKINGTEAARNASSVCREAFKFGNALTTLRRLTFNVTTGANYRLISKFEKDNLKIRASSTTSDSLRTFARLFLFASFTDSDRLGTLACADCTYERTIILTG